MRLLHLETLYNVTDIGRIDQYPQFSSNPPPFSLTIRLPSHPLIPIHHGQVYKVYTPVIVSRFNSKHHGMIILLCYTP